MTLQEIKDTFKQVSLAHVDIKEFNFGETFDIPNGGDNAYPFAFLEIPYLESIDNRRSKTLNFALNILITTGQDNRVEDHQAISDGNSIGEAIITRIQTENKELFFELITAISLREFSDDDVAGMRFEFVIRTGREFCDADSYADKFKDC